MIYKKTVTTISLPTNLLAQLDELVPPRRRSELIERLIERHLAKPHATDKRWQEEAMREYRKRNGE